jgi:hypothetical protein
LLLVLDKKISEHALVCIGISSLSSTLAWFGGWMEYDKRWYGVMMYGSGGGGYGV